MVTSSNKKARLTRLLFIVLFTIVPIIHFLVFYVYVNLNSFTMAFQREVNGQIVWGFDNIRRFFNEFGLSTSEIRLSFVNTAKSFLVGLIMFPIGILVSYFLYKKIFLYRMFRVLFFLPSIISSVVINTVYREFVGVNGPIAQMVAQILNLDYIPALLGETRFANTFVFINTIWLAFPGSMVIWGGTFSRIPVGVLEAARLDGVNWRQETFHIIIPIVWPTFALQCMLMFASFFSSSGNVFLLTNGQWGTQTLSNWMYMQVYAPAQSGGGAGVNTFSYLSAVGLMLTAVATVLAVTLRWLGNKMFKEVEY